MTNEEKKSNEIATEYLSGHDRFEVTYEEMREAVLDMAEWKDQQFKNYLEKKIHTIESMKDIDTTLPTDTAVVRTIKEIINELFNDKAI